MTTIEIVGSPLYQWEVGRQIRVTPSPGVRITAVQFAKLGDNEALSVAPSEPSGVIIATIPNILLQDNRSLVVYITDMSEDRIEAFTDKTFTIIGRPKPSDYVCTETEVLNYAYLDERLKDLEGEGLANAVAEYLKENPVEAGATAEEAAQIEQNKTNIATLDRTKLAASELPNAVNEALAQAKASGAFDGKDGKDGKDGADGQPGADGKDYVLTEADKQEIAEQAAGMVEVPEGVYFAKISVAWGGVYSFTEGSYEELYNAYLNGMTVGLDLNGSIYYLANVDSDNAMHFGNIPYDDGDYATTSIINFYLVVSPDGSITQTRKDIALSNAIPMVPTTLPNPNALTFTGAATGTYDGSAPLTVNIPAGGSGTGGSGTVSAELVYSFVADGETMNVFEPFAMDEGKVYAIVATVPEGSTSVTAPMFCVRVGAPQAVTYYGAMVSSITGQGAYQERSCLSCVTRNGNAVRLLNCYATISINLKHGKYQGDNIYIYSATADTPIIAGSFVEIYRLG